MSSVLSNTNEEVINYNIEYECEFTQCTCHNSEVVENNTNVIDNYYSTLIQKS